MTDRMAELDALLGHRAKPGATSRPCARCGGHRGHGQKYCADCRQDAKREYNARYHRQHYRRLTPVDAGAGYLPCDRISRQRKAGCGVGLLQIS